MRTNGYPRLSPLLIGIHLSSKTPTTAHGSLSLPMVTHEPTNQPRTAAIARGQIHALARIRGRKSTSNHSLIQTPSKHPTIPSRVTSREIMYHHSKDHRTFFVPSKNKVFPSFHNLLLTAGMTRMKLIVIRPAMLYTIRLHDGQI